MRRNWQRPRWRLHIASAPRQQGDSAFDDVALHNAYKQAGSGDEDLMAFGKSFIANPDLTAHLRVGSPFNPADRATFYGDSEAGHTDDPALGN